MKQERNILLAFVLNLAFALFEFLGGIYTGSVAILSDGLHDLGDAVSIGLSWFFEKKSKQGPNERYTYGYGRFSLLGGLITTAVLSVGSVLVILHAIERLSDPGQIRYNGMILFALVGVLVNGSAALFTRKGESVNQKAVNLHLLEDVLGWIVVLIGAVIMKLTNFSLLDPILSIAVAVFILIHGVEHLKEILSVFLETAPEGLSPQKIKDCLLQLEGVTDVQHIHVWSLDGRSNSATLHILSPSPSPELKASAREALRKMGITHSTIEMDNEGKWTGESGQLPN